MGSKTSTVGGGSATGVANDFNSFLKQGLNNGSFGAAGQTSGLGASLDALLKGRTGDPTGLNDYQQTLTQMQNEGRYTPSTISAQNSANPLDDASNPFNVLMKQLGQQNLSGGLGSQANVGSFGAQSGDIGRIMSQVGSQANLGSLNPYIGNLNNASSQLGNAAGQQVFTRTPTDVNSAYGNAVQQLLQQKQTRDIGDLRARYAITGGSQGTPASSAEALYRSQMTPQIVAALGGINQNEQNLDLQAAQLNSQNSLGQSSQALQALLGAGNLAGTGREQDLSNQLGNRNADIGAGNMSVANAAQMNQANTTARGQDINNFLQSRGLDLQQLGLMNSSQLSQAGLGLNAAQAGMQNNQFNSAQNLSAQGQNASNGLNAQNLWQSLLGSTGQLALNGGQLNLANANSNTQNQQAALQSLLQMFGQANQLGTPQAQVVQQPGLFSQIGSAASGLGNLFGSFNGLFGGGNQGLGTQMPIGQQTPSSSFPLIPNQRYG